MEGKSCSLAENSFSKFSRIITLNRMRGTEKIPMHAILRTLQTEFNRIWASAVRDEEGSWLLSIVQDRSWSYGTKDATFDGPGHGELHNSIPTVFSSCKKHSGCLRDAFVPAAGSL
eukprot:scaffold663_cov341-Pavlova_lutheri.AAC.14